MEILKRGTDLSPLCRRELSAGTPTLPAIVARGGVDAQRAFAEFFTAHIRNPNTRQAYARAAWRFLSWAEDHRLELRQVTPVHVAAYIETHPASAPTVKQHLAATRALFDHLVRHGILPHNPAAPVRGPKHVVEKGKTPVLEASDARSLLDSIEIDSLKGLRDCALIGTMLYTSARVGAVTRMRVRDYHHVGRRSWIRLLEKGGKHHEVPAHQALQAYLDAYLAAAVLEGPSSPLFQTLTKSRRALTGAGMTSRDVQRMLMRRGPPGRCGGGVEPAQLPSDGHHRVPAQRRNPRARPTHRGARQPPDDEALRPDWRSHRARRNRENSPVMGVWGWNSLQAR